MPTNGGFSAKIEIKEAYCIGERVTLSSLTTCNYNPLVRSPKITAVFMCDGETRYLPFEIKSYFPDEDLNACSIISEYTFEMDYIFKKYNSNEKISICFNLDYGDNYVENLNIVYSVDTDIGDKYFNIEVNNECDCLELKVSPENININTSNKFVSVLKRGISNLYNFVVRLIGYVMIPLFLIDAFMARLSLTGYNQRIASREGILFFADHVRLRFKAVTKQDIGRGRSKRLLAKNLSFLFSNKKVVKNRITFLSNRRDDLSGNFEYIYDILKQNKELDIQMLLDSTPLHRMSNKNIFKFAKLYATSAVVIVDDFYELTSIVPKKDDVKLMQVWHACGAFKTFGFSRLGKPGGPRQTSSHHRCYDYAVVSSSNIRRYYAEGFGITVDNVVATGVPRTDIFFDENYKQQRKNEFYEKYPKLKDKKIMLFAPTFRGNGKLTGSYPVKKFDLKTVYEQTNGEYAIIVKLHPFIRDKFNIPKKYKDYILDFSECSELNDLLFVTDLLVTDYSSAVFEASLLDIPMLFYAFDLYEYIASRDFYCEYKSFLPGKLVYNLSEFVEAVNKNDFESEKIPDFKNKFFDEQDGGSSKRVAELIENIINE